MYYWNTTDFETSTKRDESMFHVRSSVGRTIVASIVRPHKMDCDPILLVEVDMGTPSRSPTKSLAAKSR
jgi:hypothetical protein